MASSQHNRGASVRPAGDENQQSPALLRALLITLLLGATLAIVASLPLKSSSEIFFFADIFLAVSCAVLLVLLGRGHSLMVARGTIGMIFLCITAVHPFHRVYFGVEVAGYVLVVALAGALLSRRSVLLVTIASIAAIFWAGSVRYSGGLTNVAAQFDVLSYSVFCTSVAFILFFSRRGSSVALKRAEQDAQQLAHQVVQRTAEMAANEHYFESLINASQDVIVFVDLAGIIKFESPSIETLLGYKTGERLGRDMTEFGHPDDLVRVREAMARQLTGSAALSMVSLRALHAEGYWVDTECTGKFVRDKDTNAILGMVVSMRDATLRKQSQAAIEQRIAFEKLTVDISTRLLSLPVDQSEAGIQYALKRLGEFTGVNAARLVRIDLNTHLGATTHYWPMPHEPVSEDGLTQPNPWADTLQHLIQTSWPLSASSQEDALVRLIVTQGFATIRDTAAIAPQSPVAAQLWRLNVRACLSVAVMQGSDAILILVLDMFGPHANAELEAEQMIGRDWSDDHVRLAQLVGQLISSTLSRHQTFAKLARQTAIQELVADVSNRIAAGMPEQIDGTVHYALQRLGEFTQVDIARLFFFDPTGKESRNTHEWVAPGIQSQQNRLQDMSWEDKWWVRQFQSQHVICFDTADLVSRASHQGHLPVVASPDDLKVQTVLQGLGAQSVLGVALLRDGEVVGEVGLDTLHAKKQWSAEEISLVQLVAEALNSALSRQQINEKLQHRLAFEKLVAETSNRFVSIAPEQTDRAIQDTLQQIGEFMHTDYCRLFLINDDRQSVRNTQEWTAEGVPSRKKLRQNYVFEESDFVWLRYLQEHRLIYFATLEEMPEELEVCRLELQKHGPRSRAAVSLWRDDTMLGTLTLDVLRTQMHFTDENIRLLQVVAEIISNALNRKYSYEQIQHRLSFEHLISNISNQFNAAAPAEVDQAIHQAMRQIGEFSGMDVARLFLIAEDGQSVNNTHEWAADEADLRQPMLQNLPMQNPGRQYLYERLMRDGMVHYDNVADMPLEFGNLQTVMTTLGVRSFINVLLRRGDEVLGDLGLSSQYATIPFVAENLQMLRVVGELISNVLTRKQANHKLSQLALALEAERNQLERRVAERTKELSQLLEVAKTISLTLDLQAFMAIVLQSLQEVIPFDVGAIWELLAENQLRELSSYGSEAADLSSHSVWTYDPQQDSHLREMMTTHRPVVIGDIYATDARSVAHRQRWMRINGGVPESVRATIYAPLVSHDLVKGYLVLHSATADFFDEPKVALVQAFASQVAISLENALLHEQKVYAAAMAERSRLARELHDSVSQALFGVVLGTRTAIQLSGNSPSSEAMAYVLKQSEAALAEMRALIYELRPESLETEGMISALRRQATALSARHNLEVDLELDSEEPLLPIKTKEALYRIGIEAVQNTIKHALATQVKMTFHVTPQEVLLQVQDNGRGFDLTVPTPGHFGLIGMRERAENLGAQFGLQSAPGQGTSIQIRIPLTPAIHANGTVS